MRLIRLVTRLWRSPPEATTPAPAPGRPTREITARPCGYCDRPPPYRGWNDGVCEECARRLSASLMAGVPLAWRRD